MPKNQNSTLDHQPDNRVLRPLLRPSSITRLSIVVELIVLPRVPKLPCVSGPSATLHFLDFLSFSEYPRFHACRPPISYAVCEVDCLNFEVLHLVFRFICHMQQTVLPLVFLRVSFVMKTSFHGQHMDNSSCLMESVCRFHPPAIFYVVLADCLGKLSFVLCALALSLFFGLHTTSQIFLVSPSTILDSASFLS